MKYKTQSSYMYIEIYRQYQSLRWLGERKFLQLMHVPGRQAVLSKRIYITTTGLTELASLRKTEHLINHILIELHEIMSTKQVRE